jgi:chromosome segregation ATPase
MFGSRKIQELEYKLRDVTESLDRAYRDNRELEQKLSQSEAKYGQLESQLSDVDQELKSVTESLDRANGDKQELEEKLSASEAKLQELESQLTDVDLEQLKEEARISHAEFEGLRNLYSRKVKEFEDTLEEKEQNFAKEDALKRYNLENEIVDNRKANQAYVADRVKRFGESYNYYLNQIKVLMDALGDIAIHTGSALFTEEYEGRNLMTTIGQEMVDRLKSETNVLRGDENDSGVVLIGNVTEEDISVVEAVAAEVGAMEGEEGVAAEAPVEEAPAA